MVVRDVAPAAKKKGDGFLAVAGKEKFSRCAC